MYVIGNNKANGLEQVSANYKSEDVLKVKFMRMNNIIYYSINDEDYYELQNYNVFAEYFDIPVTFGASIDENNEPFRYFKGKLSNIKIKLLDKTDITAYELVYKAPTTTFNGTNYLNSQIYLFNEENLNKDFEIKFTVTSYDENQEKYAVLMNCLDEANEEYPGVLFRHIGTENKFQVVANKIDEKNSLSLEQTDIETVKILRKQNKIYYSIKHEKFVEINDFIDFSVYFDVPVTFGAGIDENNEPFRYFKGTLSNIEIRIKQ